MYLLNNATQPMTAKKALLFDGLMNEESPQTMGGLLLTLVVLLHMGVFYFIKTLTPTEPVKPIVIMEVSMVAIPLPVADVPPPLAAPEPPKPIIPKPLPPPPKPIVKPKPKPKLEKPKPVIHKTEPIYIPVDEKPSPLPVANPTPAPAPAKAAPAKAAPPAAAPKESFTPATQGANYGYNPKPKYPSIARSRGWTGKVVLSVRVSASGESEGVSVSQSSGHDVLDDAAVAAVEGWRFVPAKRGDTAVASTVQVPINFKLDN
jgi:protein TonB